ncbi:MAG: HNH endonuclease domain-containing protein, partial [Vulcanimicrobiaceae bacterium]
VNRDFFTGGLLRGRWPQNSPPISGAFFRLHVTKYLEKVNWLAPAIIDKVERDGARRSSLTKYLRILRETDENRCFYCSRDFSNTTRIEVDHVLPWTFLLSDALWDLVLSCSACNAAKSDRLPVRDFVDKLVSTNEARAKRKLPSGVSPLSTGEAITQLYEAAIAVEWPGFWSPKVS